MSIFNIFNEEDTTQKTKDESWDDFVKRTNKELADSLARNTKNKSGYHSKLPTDKEIETILFLFRHSSEEVPLNAPALGVKTSGKLFNITPDSKPSEGLDDIRGQVKKASWENSKRVAKGLRPIGISTLFTV